MEFCKCQIYKHFFSVFLFPRRSIPFQFHQKHGICHLMSKIDSFLCSSLLSRSCSFKILSVCCFLLCFPYFNHRPSNISILPFSRDRSLGECRSIINPPPKTSQFQLMRPQGGDNESETDKRETFMLWCLHRSRVFFSLSQFPSLLF